MRVRSDFVLIQQFVRSFTFLEWFLSYHEVTDPQDPIALVQLYSKTLSNSLEEALSLMDLL